MPWSQLTTGARLANPSSLAKATTSDKQGVMDISYAKAARKQQASSNVSWTTAMQRLLESNKRQARHQLCAKAARKQQATSNASWTPAMQGWEMAQNCTPTLDNNSTQGDIFTSLFLIWFCFLLGFFLLLIFCFHVCAHVSVRCEADSLLGDELCGLI